MSEVTSSSLGFLRSSAIKVLVQVARSFWSTAPMRNWYWVRPTELSMVRSCTGCR